MKESALGWPQNQGALYLSFKHFSMPFVWFQQPQETAFQNGFFQYYVKCPLEV